MPDFQPRQPSDLYPGLTWDRLIVLCRLIWDSRIWVAENATPERGDSRCGVGFRAWEHGKHAVTVAAVKERADWLSVVDQGPRFIFQIAGMPVRFCKGDTDKPVPMPENYSFANQLERDHI